MKITIEFNTGRKEKFTLPTWDTITIGQWERMVSEWDREDPLQLFSILVGEDLKAVEKAKSKKVIIPLMQGLTPIYNGPDFNINKLDMPQELLGVKIPRNIGSLSLGQTMIAYRKYLSSEEYQTAGSFVIAVYLQPLIDRGEFNRERVNEIHERVKAIPFKQARPVANFFLRKLRRDLVIGMLSYVLRAIMSLRSDDRRRGWRELARLKNMAKSV